MSGAPTNPRYLAYCVLAHEPRVLVRIQTNAVIACRGPGIPHVKPLDLISYGVFGTKISEVILPGAKVSIGLTRESANAMRRSAKLAKATARKR